MKLIEQLGGYEKSKMELKLKEEDSIFQCCAAITADMIRNALLEHRRTHNIFEVRDRVVLLKNQHMWHKMEGIYTVTSTDIYDGITIGVAIEYKNTSHGNEIGNIRHATDAEIKAGHRL